MTPAIKARILTVLGHDLESANYRLNTARRLCGEWAESEARDRVSEITDAMAEVDALPVHTLDTLISGALAHKRNMALTEACPRLAPEVVQGIIARAEERMATRTIALPVKGQA